MVTDRKAPKSMLDRNKLVCPAIILCTSAYKVQCHSYTLCSEGCEVGFDQRTYPGKTEMTL